MLAAPEQLRLRYKAAVPCAPVADRSAADVICVQQGHHVPLHGMGLDAATEALRRSAVSNYNHFFLMEVEQ